MYEEINFWVSVCLFLITFVFILSEKVNRVAIAFFGAVLMVVYGQLLGFYEFNEVMHSVDFNTLLLLFGMMIIVAVLEKSGFFQYLAIKTAKKTGGNLWYLTLLLGTLTSVLSMILDNVTTIILIVPVTIIITKLLKVNATPILMSEVILSNIGGVGTLVGDPPNILIASATGFSFNTFLTHSLPVVILSWFMVLSVIRLVFRKEFDAKPKSIKALMAMDEKKVIKNKDLMRRTLLTLVFVIVLFFAHSSFHIPPSFVALMGASLLLLLVSEHYNLPSILKKIEINVLIFFASLFVMVGGLEQTGVLKYLAEAMVSGLGYNMLYTALIILWVSAILSSIIDNIPMTIAMIPILGYLSSTGIPETNLLWWALVFGVGFGGNGTPIGSTAGVIVTAKSKSTKETIGLKIWMKSGLPSMLMSLTIASFGLIIFADYFAK